VVFDDSDRFLAVELGPLCQEHNFLQYEPPSPKRIAEKLSIWTTQEHRDQADHVLLYKAGDPPKDLGALIRQTDAFLKEVKRHLRDPQPRLEHPHWLGGVGAWRAAREYRGVTRDPPELAPTLDIRVRPSGTALMPARGLARSLLFGNPGHRSMQHPYWRLERALKRRLRATAATDRVSVLGAAASMRLLNESYAPLTDADPEQADAVIAFMDLASAQRVEQLIGRLHSLRPNRPAVLVALKTAEVDIGELALANLISSLDTDFLVEAMECFDLRTDRKVELAHGSLADARTAGIRTFARLGVASLLASLRMWTANALIAAGLMRAPSGALTAVLIICRRRPAADS
jgi:hypothetical protein